MKTSDSIAKIAPALLAAQNAVKHAVKSGVNPHFKSRYAPLEEVIAACKDSLNNNGIIFLQGAEQGDGDLLHLTTRLMHTSGEWVESTLTMRPSKNDPQGIGSCMTYARRYALAAICGVASEEDDDGNAASETPKPKKAQKETAQPSDVDIALEMVRELFQKLPAAKRNIDTMKSILPVADFAQVKDCSLEQLHTGIDRLNAMLTEGK